MNKKSTEYIYGEFKPEPLDHRVALNRIECATKHIKKLLEVDYRKRDYERLRHALKAKQFWERFLNGEYQ